MENYFQAEAYNLDKVLDEFEQNEDETVSPALLDKKWNQLLDPHLLSFSPALTSVNETALPSESQRTQKTFSRSHPTLLPSVEGGDHCPNGRESALAPDTSTMCIDDQATAEEQLLQSSSPWEDQCSAGEAGEEKPGNRDSLSEENNILVVAVMHNCDKRTLPSALDCNNYNSHSLMDTISFTLDAEHGQNDPFSAAVNGAEEKDTNTEKPGRQPSQRHARDDPVGHLGPVSPEKQARVRPPSPLKDDIDSRRDPPALGAASGGAGAPPSPRAGPAADEQDSCVPVEAPAGRSGSPGMEVETTDGSTHLGGRLSIEEEPPEEGTAADPFHGLPLGPDRLKGSESDACREQLSCGLAPKDAKGEESEGCEPGQTPDPTESLGPGGGVSASEEAAHWELTELSGKSSSPTSGQPERLLPRSPPKQACCDGGENGEALAEAGVRLKGTCLEELEGYGFPAVLDVPAANSLSNGCDSYGMLNPVIACIPKTLPSKEDSVTEEKEIEESKSECYGSVYEQRGHEASEGNGLGLSSTSDQTKKNSARPLCSQGSSGPGQLSPPGAAAVPPLSVPFGGARPKQPANLKLQIPKPLSEHLQNDPPPHGGPSAKNKNGGFGKAKSGESSTGAPFPNETLHSAGADANGELGEEYEAVVSRSPCLAVASDSPDNDLRAGQFGVPTRKPFTTLGEVAPVWVPDSQAPNCMKCEARFTFTKRRHHCRACGKVFCAACCSLKCKLLYMERKEARVCVICHSVLMNVAQPREQRRVWFADGILPNGEVADAAKLTVSGPSSTGALAVSHDPAQPVSSSPLPAEMDISAFSGSITQVGSPVGSAMNLIPEDGLPPILISTGVKGDYAVEERPSQISVMQQLEDGGPDPLVFVLNANLLSMVKIVNYVNRKCWCFTTKGMHAVGQSEVVILLQCLPDEKCLPKDIFSHFVQLYRDALAGNVVGCLGHSFFSQSFLGSKEHGGFLYVTSTYQSLQDLVLPTPPYLFGILIQKWETPWAKVFPIRLMLRLGAEYRLYPCPLFSVRFRKPLFGETGHTIMNLLADFRNYQYTLPVVQGLVVDMEVRKTSIKIPSNRYNEMMKVMNKSNEHVLAGGACFNEKADSHLVCVQNDDGNYQTQAISIHNQPRKVTGAGFFVFSGALKASSGYLAKSSIVEDGVMVQITAENMDSLRQSLREMKDFTITCGKVDAEDPQEHIHIQWVDDDKNFNKGVVSPIDGKSMESVTSVKIFHGSEYKANGKVIRWTEVFFLENEDQHNGLSDPADHSRLTEHVAKAFCLALCPHLKLLKEDGMTRLGLRVALDSEQVGYQAGSNGQPLPAQYMKDLDSALVPVIHGGACQLSEGPLVMELTFYILENIS
ncbi:zinc finger FYVE domain-containing protein 9 isoform X2 [Monodelphis domestica]|uniref:zinc finger FYVE domain-containing protein 9 isoform X2 n=1 Tax=Monodelphis domestica TaxID=13616 RepID=UPI0024E1C214|nr:zinc finger FYVE domain-containing protein 9 isoform X2 [Monodelphis domestica]